MSINFCDMIDEPNALNFKNSTKKKTTVSFHWIYLPNVNSVE